MIGTPAQPNNRRITLPLEAIWQKSLFQTADVIMLLKFISIFSSFPHWYLQRLQSFLAALNAEPALRLFVSALESIVEEAQSVLHGRSWLQRNISLHPRQRIIGLQMSLCTWSDREIWRHVKHTWTSGSFSRNVALAEARYFLQIY